jgi:hypothetical protein
MTNQHADATPEQTPEQIQQQTQGHSCRVEDALCECDLSCVGGRTGKGTLLQKASQSQLQISRRALPQWRNGETPNGTVRF